MTRSDGDSWDLASSVGATATMVAAARALATADPDGFDADTPTGRGDARSWAGP